METTQAIADEKGPEAGEGGELVYRFMSPEYADRVLEFKSRYLRSRGGAGFADWKYRQGPIDCRDCEIIVLAPDGSMVGHLGAVVFPAVPGSRVPRICLGTEFIVDERYRGGKHDVIRKMDAMLGERLAEKGAELMFGTPNKPGYLVARRLHRRVDGAKCAYLSKVFTPALWVPRGALRKAAHRLLSLGRFPLPAMPAGWSWDLPVRFAAEEIDGFCGEFMRGIDFGARRDAEFLNWRYGGGDGYAYERIRLCENGRTAALAVLRIDPSRCEPAALMECMALDARGYDLLLGICLNQASRSAPALSVFGVADSPAMAACLRQGFRPNAEILDSIGRALARAPAKLRERLVTKAENHYHVDDYLTVFYYPDPKRCKDFVPGRWHVTLGEKFGF